MKNRFITIIFLIISPICFCQEEDILPFPYVWYEADFIIKGQIIKSDPNNKLIKIKCNKNYKNYLENDSLFVNYDIDSKLSKTISYSRFCNFFNGDSVIVFLKKNKRDTIYRPVNSCWWIKSQSDINLFFLDSMLNIFSIIDSKKKHKSKRERIDEIAGWLVHLAADSTTYHDAIFGLSELRYCFGRSMSCVIRLSTQSKQKLRSIIMNREISFFEETNILNIIKEKNDSILMTYLKIQFENLVDGREDIMVRLMRSIAWYSNNSELLRVKNEYLNAKSKGNEDIQRWKKKEFLSILSTIKL